MRPISLILLVHDDLSPGEREDRVARAHDRVWRPLLDALLAAPRVNLALHLSGTLTEWMDAQRQDSLDLLAGLVERDQVEFVGGSPVGAALQGLPERDAVAHLQGMARWAEERLGRKPRGVWLGRGGWDPSLPRVLARGGGQYTFVDRTLVETSGRDADGRSPWSVAEREGAAVGVIPLDPRLPALVPWALPRYLGHELKARALAGERFLAAAIPAEVLGLRHGSRHWCWNGSRSWVPSFMDMLNKQASWLKTLLPRQAVDGNRPAGRIYPSAGTPSSTGAGGLDAGQASSWRQLRRDVDAGLDPALQRYRRWIVGPPWEAHLARHDASNLIHKRMLRVSASVQRVRRQLRDAKGRRDPSRLQAYEHARGWLYAGQGGAVLHGGAAGGPDRPDLRHAAWRALLSAQAVARQALSEHDLLCYDVLDADCDGLREVVVATPYFSVMVRPSLGGAIGELGLWHKGNLVNCIKRSEESWHSELHFVSAMPVLVQDGSAQRLTPDEAEDQLDTLTGATADDEGAEELADDIIDDLIDDDFLVDPSAEGDDSGTTGTLYTEQLEHVDLPDPPSLPVPAGDVNDLLVCDHHHRMLFQERFLGPGTSLDNLRRDQHPEQGDFVDGTYALMSAETPTPEVLNITMAREGVVVCDGAQRLVRVLKRVVISRDLPEIKVSYDVANRYTEPVSSRFAVELNLGLDGDDSGDRFLQTDGQRSLLSQDGEWTEVSDLSLVMADLGLRVRIQASSPATLYFYGVRSLVETCEGYERAFHGTCLVLAWDLELWGEERHRFDLTLSVDAQGSH